MAQKVRVIMTSAEYGSETFGPYDDMAAALAAVQRMYANTGSLQDGVVRTWQVVPVGAPCLAIPDTHRRADPEHVLIRWECDADREDEDNCCPMVVQSVSEHIITGTPMCDCVGDAVEMSLEGVYVPAVPAA